MSLLRPLAALCPALVVAACTAPPPAPATAPDLELQIGGCVELPSARCEVRPGGTIVVWARTDPDARLTAPTGARAKVSPSTLLQDGLQWSVTASSSDTSLQVVAYRGEARRHRTISIVVRPEPPSVTPHLEDLAAGADFDGLTALAPPLRARVISAWVRRNLVDAPSDPDRWLAQLSVAQTLHSVMDHRLAAAKDQILRAWISARARRLVEARRLVQQTAFDPGQAAQVRLPALNTLALVARDEGDLRGTMRALNQARLEAERVGDLRQWRYATQIQIPIAARLGAAARARELASSLLARTPPEAGCDRFGAVATALWAHLLLSEDAKIPSLGPAEQALMKESAVTWADCRLQAAPALVNLADIAHRLGDAREARAWLARAKRQQPPPGLQPWIALLDSDLWADAGAWARAKAKLREVHALGPTAEVAWAAQVREGELLVRRGRLDEAVIALEASEDLLQDRLAGVGVADGRVPFAAHNLRGSRGLVDAYAGKGDAKRALEAARRAAARGMIGLRRQGRLQNLSAEERAAWSRHVSAYYAARDEILRLPVARSEAARTRRRARAQALRAQSEQALDEAFGILDAGPAAALPDPSDPMLVIHPGHAVWWALTWDGRAAKAHRLGGLHDDEAALRRALVEVVRGLPEAKPGLRVHALGAAAGWDVHAFAVGGTPLGWSVPITYGLDGPNPEDVAPQKGRRALLVIDPQDDLPMARREAEAVVSDLERRGWSVRQLTGAAATVRAVREGLADADLLHFAGHGAAGDDPLSASLGLSDGLLEASDILAGADVPDHVVLSGCETGRPGGGGAAGVGMAQAFILAGSRAVLATQRPVSDVLASRVGRRLYAGVDGWLPAAHRALREAASALESEDWAAYRIWVR